jgi:hypothetical protein
MAGRKRKTALDAAFAAKFGERLDAAFEHHVKNKKNPNRISVEAFAKSLNLTRAGLHKAMKGKSVPGLNLIEHARQYGVSVGYGDLTARMPSSARKKGRAADLQLFLPFAVENLKKDNVRVELGEHKGDSVELKVLIKFVS